MRRFFFRLGAFLRRHRGDAELTREIDAHLRLLEDTYRSQGMSAADARDAARRAFGGQVEQVKLRQRDARSFRWLDESWLDFKLGARMLIKYPGLSLVGGLAMAVAIAFGTGMFAFFYAYMATTLPFDEGDRIVALENWNVAVNNEERRSTHDYVTWRNELTSMAEIGAFRTIGRNLIVAGGTVEPVQIAEMTASGFRIARVAPLLGRPLLDEDERDGAPPVLVIGQEVWQSRFASDPAVVGRDVRLGNVVHTVVGIMPAGFGFPMNHSYWVPMRIDPSRVPRGQGPSMFVFGRLAAGVTVEQAQAELTTIGQRAAAEFPGTHAQLSPRVLPYTYPLLDIQDMSMWQVGVMQAIISLLLVVVAVNVAILVYARTATRQGEISIRTALGASRSRIVTQLFIEALVLSSAAAAVGIVLARFGLNQGHAIIRLEGITGPFWMDYSFPLPALAFVFALTILAALIAGVLPALQATGRRVQARLRDLGGGTGMQLGKTWTVLIVAQVAFAVVALPTAVSMGWHEIRFAMTAPQFAAEQFLAATVVLDPDAHVGVDPATAQRQTVARAARLQAELVSRLEAESWAADVTLATGLPGHEGDARAEIEHVPSPATDSAYGVKINRIEIDYFDAFEIPILTGRRLTTTDAEAVIVNRTFADQLVPDGDALGRRLRFVQAADGNLPATASPAAASRWYEIVGVAADLHANPIDRDMASPEVYRLRQPGATPANLIVRVRGGAPTTYATRLLEIAAAIDPTLRIRAFPLLEIYRQQNIALRLVALAVGLSMLSVLLLSAAGIYALMSFTVSRRRKEIGIRTALGANPRHLLASIFARAAVQLGIGLAIGLLIVILLNLTSTGDPLGEDGAVLLPAVLVLMVVAGLAAAFGPARRGLRIEPTQALREE